MVRKVNVELKLKSKGDYTNYNCSGDHNNCNNFVKKALKKIVDEKVSVTIEDPNASSRSLLEVWSYISVFFVIYSLVKTISYLCKFCKKKTQEFCAGKQYVLTTGY